MVVKKLFYIFIALFLATSTRANPDQEIIVLAELVEETGGSKIHIAKFKVLKVFQGSITQDTISVGYYFYTWEGRLPQTAFLHIKPYRDQKNFPNYYIALDYNATENFIVPKAQQKIDGLNYWGIYGCGDPEHAPENCKSTGESAAMFDRLTEELKAANINYTWHNDRYILLDYK